ncbi:hypothetical protein CLV98_106138 [Dyadobacter jejuensis]|uniref:CBU-0592-like domain-containing protein n=1 Tax=Dyadobacter jejuensis TaxID=1082580 RepID=A0A316AIZ5_9BACT|nr:hypothetical protein [Dyadobacter jejuensis]PWJ57666.1 hypothetical protein CLV98_106138 [Dyadobacter jejuensis]
MDPIIVALAGWAGVGFYVLAYFLLSIGRLDARQYNFHFLNILGAIGLIIDASAHHDLPNLVVNCIWLLIGSAAIASRYLSVRRP